jgi:hypothetical protein
MKTHRSIVLASALLLDCGGISNIGSGTEAHDDSSSGTGGTAGTRNTQPDDPSAGQSGADGASIAHGGRGGSAGYVAHRCETTTLSKVFKHKCGACHSNASVPIAKPDLVTPGYTFRMLDQPAAFYAVLPTQMPACPAGVKVIDTADPSESWFVKKLQNDTNGCGTEMPQAPLALTTAERLEITRYLSCIGAPADVSLPMPGGGGDRG